MANPWKKLETYNETPYFLENPTRDSMRQSDRAISLSDITTYIYQSLIDFQGKWEDSDLSGWKIKMPNARYLAIGDKVYNRTTGNTYIIADVVDAKQKIVRLNSTSVTRPVVGDVFELEEKNMINFESAYSRYYQDKPITDWRDTIIFRVKRREPGTIGKHPFDPPTEIKPRIRQYVTDPDHQDCHIMVLGQWFDNLIQFDCWSKYNNRADELIEWFEDFVYKYTWVWKKNGVNELLYWMRNIDEESTKFRNDLAVRTVIYYFKTEKIVTVREYDFKQIDLYLELENASPSGFYGVSFGNAALPSGHMEIMDRGFTTYV
jgi:hypothetical protein